MSTRAYTLQDIISLLSQESEPFVDSSGTETFNQFLLAGETSHLSDSPTTITTATAASATYGTNVLGPLGFEKIVGPGMPSISGQNVNYAPAFVSLGTNAAGDLHAWTALKGTPSISANVLTLSGNVGDQLLYGGHPLWTYGMRYRARFQWNTGSQPCLYIDFNPARVLGSAGTFNESWVRMRVDAGGAKIWFENLSQSCNGVINVVASTTGWGSLTSGNWYWMEAIVDPSPRGIPGTTAGISFNLWNDTNGTIGPSAPTGTSSAFSTFAPENGIIYGGFMGLGNAAGNSQGCKFGGAFPNTVTAEIDMPEWAGAIAHAWTPALASNRESGFAVVPLVNPVTPGPTVSPWVLTAPFSAPGTSWRALSIYTPASLAGVQAEDSWAPAASTQLTAVSASTKYVISGWVQTTAVLGGVNTTSGAYLAVDEFNSAGTLINTTVPNASTAPFTSYSMVGTQGVTRLQFLLTTQGTTAFIRLRPALNVPGLAAYSGLRIDQNATRWAYSRWN